jgi:hypothetical protein
MVGYLIEYFFEEAYRHPNCLNSSQFFNNQDLNTHPKSDIYFFLSMAGLLL